MTINSKKNLDSKLQEKINYAIAQLKLHEPKEGYYVAFSGGKDSCVILDLVQRARVKYDAHYNITTVDPKEVIQFIYEKHRCDVKIEKPAISMWKLAKKKGIMPTRQRRYCCAIYKEKGGENRKIITGIRHEESKSRAKRKLIEPCNKHNGKQFLHIIIDWLTTEIWEYIEYYDIPYCKLYDQGWSRIGCVGCPLVGAKKRRQELQQYPQIAKIWKRGCQAIISRNKEENKDFKFKTTEDLYNWWLSGKSIANYAIKKEKIFGVLSDEKII